MWRLIQSMALRLILVIMVLFAADWVIKNIGAQGEWHEPILVLLGAIYAVVEIIGNRDRFTTASALKSSAQSSNNDTTVESYLNGRLILHQEEERQFVKLAGDVVIETEYFTNTETFPDIDKVIDKFPSGFILIGEPGAGKSTALRHLERALITRYQRDNSKHRWPLWINLGLTDNPVAADQLIDYWWQRNHLPSTPDQLFRHQPFLLLLDGLNEMPLDTRNERVASFRQYLNTVDAPLPVVITCRADDYKNDEQLAFNMPAVHIHELDNNRIRKFLKNRHVAEMWLSLERDETLLSMARNPYKLAMLITIYDKQTNSLPVNVYQLYSLYVQKVYTEYFQERKTKLLTPLLHLTQREMEGKLKLLAFKMLVEGNGLSLHVDRTRWHVGSKVLVDGINMGILKRDGDQVQFFHQSLHTHFTIEPLSRALSVNSRFERLTKNPVALIKQISDMGEDAVPAVYPLIYTLGSENIRHNALLALQKIGKPAVDILILALKDTDPSIRYNATVVLGLMGDPRAVVPLIHSITSLNFHNDYRRVINSITKIGKSAIEPLIGALDDNDPHVRKVAITVLGEIGDPRVVEPLIGALDDNDPHVRKVAITALGEIGDPRVVEPLIGALDDDLELSRYITQTLGTMGKIGVDALTHIALTNNQALTRCFAIEALSSMNKPHALVHIWLKGDPFSRFYVSGALINLNDNNRLYKLLLGEPKPSKGLVSLHPKGHQQLGFLLFPVFQKYSDIIFREAAKSLGELNDASIFSSLIVALKDKDVFVHTFAAWMLTEVGEPIVDYFIQAMRKENSSERQRVRELLHRVGTPETLKVFESAFNND